MAPSAPSSAVVTGVSIGLPGSRKKVFDEKNFERLLKGESFIEKLSLEERKRQLAKNITRLVKNRDGTHIQKVAALKETVKLAGKSGELDLERDFEIPPKFSQAMDRTAQLALAASLLALKDARLPPRLPEALSRETGVIFASAFPGFDSLASEVSRCGNHSRPYEFDRNFIFRMMPLGHAQIAQWIGAKGPAVHVNAGFASTVVALSLAEDWIRLGRARRVVVAAAEDGTSPALQEWLISAFLSLGAATTEGEVSLAALPFDERRKGTVLGMGAAAFVLEERLGARRRGIPPPARILASEHINWGWHLTKLDTEQIVVLLENTLRKAGFSSAPKRRALASRLLYMSHETYTPAKGGSASSEVAALRKVFGKNFSKILIANTKGYTGHTFGAGVEDAACIKMLQTGRVPPIANLKNPDPEFGDANLSRGGSHRCRYGLHVALGFGSQGAAILFEKGGGSPVSL